MIMDSKIKSNYWEFPMINTVSRNEYISEMIIKVVGNKLEIPSAMIVGKTRKREIVEARHIAMTLIKNNTSLSLKAIGLLFGKRDHSTVINSVRKVKELIEVNDRVLVPKYNLIVNSL